MNDSSRPISSNPALPAFVLLLCLMFLLWATPHLVGVVRGLTKELFLLLLKIVIVVARVAALIWNSRAWLRIERPLPTSPC